MTAILGRMASYSGQLVTWDEAMKSQLDLSPKRLAWDADPPVLPGPDGEYATPVPGIAKAYLTLGATGTAVLQRRSPLGGTGSASAAAARLTTGCHWLCQCCSSQDITWLALAQPVAP